MRDRKEEIDGGRILMHILWICFGCSEFVVVVVDNDDDVLTF